MFKEFILGGLATVFGAALVLGVFYFGALGAEFIGLALGYEWKLGIVLIACCFLSGGLSTIGPKNKKAR